MKTTQVKAKDVRVGDRLIAENGDVVTVIEISKGMPRNTVEFRWRGGWAAVNPMQITVQLI